MRRAIGTGAVLGAAVVLVFLAAGSGSDKGHTYWVEIDNAFGLVEGADVKLAGVRAGKIQAFKLDRRNYYGAAIDDQGNADCEAGQRGYPARLSKYAPQNLFVSMDPHTPGNQGPNFKSFDDRDKPPKDRQLDTNHMPPGETFTRDPGGIGGVP